MRKSPNSSSLTSPARRISFILMLCSITVGVHGFSVSSRTERSNVLLSSRRRFTLPVVCHLSSDTDSSSSSSSQTENITPKTTELNHNTSNDDSDLWGKAVPLKPQSTSSQSTPSDSPASDILSITPEDELRKRQRRNVVVAMASVLFALLNYAYTYFHPITPVQLLADMQLHSAPMSSIGTNGKPSVVDFWAPWCENCKSAAPTLQVIEEEYKDRVNFVLVNGDTAEAWPYIEAFGVDAIPHLALVSDEGDVETALIGPIPKSILEEDLNMLLENSGKGEGKRALPHNMLDAFANRPEKRRVHFDP